MGEITNKVKKMIQNYPKEQSKIKSKIKSEYEEKQRKIEEENQKYNETTEKIKEFNAKIASSDLHIAKLQRELSEVSPLDRELVKEYEKAIQNEENGYKDEHTGEWMPGKKEYVEEKQKLEEKQKPEIQLIKESKALNKKEMELKLNRELNSLEGELRRNLTQESIKIGEDIEKAEMTKTIILTNIKKFEYKYEEYEYENEDGEKIKAKRPINGKELVKIRSNYEKIINYLNDLRQAKEICEKELDKFKQRDAEKMKAFSQAWNDVNKKENESIVEPPKGEINPPKGEANPTKDEANPPKGEANPTKDEANSPKGEANPTKDEANPPKGETNPPKDGTNSPKGEANPPKSETNPPKGKTVPPQNKQCEILLKISNNQIWIDNKNGPVEFRYYNVEKNRDNKKALKKEYSINKLFKKDKEHKKEIDWALLSALKIIDDKNNTLVMDYLSVLKNSPLNGKDLETSLKELNEKVNIEYIFENESIFSNWKAKSLARNANDYGIASLSGIEESGFWDNVKTKCLGWIKDKWNNGKFFSKKEKLQELDSGKETTTEQLKQKNVTAIKNEMESGINSRKRDLGDLQQYVVENDNGELEKNAQEAVKLHGDAVVDEKEKVVAEISNSEENEL